MEINERVKVEGKVVVILKYDEALDWCVRNIDSWEASWLASEKPMGWEWIEGLVVQWLAPSCDGGTGGITKAIWKEAKKMAVTAEEKAALVDFGELTEEFDPGSHYRYTYRQKVTAEDLELGYVDVKFDPYRVCKVYKVDGGPREHIAKKALRGCDKGHTELELIKELQSCLDRWKEMLNEDEL